MTTKYFVLSKNNEDVRDNSKNQFISLNNTQVHILPETNLNYYYQNGLFEKSLIEWCKQFKDKDKVFLDIGAHTGTYTISLNKKFKHVYSFEPQKMTYYALCGGVALSNIQNVTCYQIGLGSTDQIGEKELRIVSHDGGGSSLHAKGNILKTEKIQILTLDTFKIDNIGFIKMDVEENELQVLKGARETLKRSNYPKILFESNFENKELFEYLKGMGYRVVKINGYHNMYLAEK